MMTSHTLTASYLTPPRNLVSDLTNNNTNHDAATKSPWDLLFNSTNGIQEHDSTLNYDPCINTCIHPRQSSAKVSCHDPVNNDPCDKNKYNLPHTPSASPPSCNHHTQSSKSYTNSDTHSNHTLGPESTSIQSPSLSSSTFAGATESDSSKGVSENMLLSSTTCSTSTQGCEAAHLSVFDIGFNDDEIKPPANSLTYRRAHAAVQYAMEFNERVMFDFRVERILGYVCI